MKLLIKKSRDQYGRKVKDGKNYLFLKISNMDDLMLYNKHYSNISAEQNVGLYMGYQRQTFRDGIMNYMVHERNISSTTRLFAFKLNTTQKDMSLIDVCNMSDNLIYQKVAGVKKLIDGGFEALINSVGGYSYISDMSDFDEEIDISEKEVLNFIVKGNINIKDWDLSKECVVIENSDSISKDLKSKMSKYINSYTEITNFKRDFHFYSPEEVVKMFVSGVKNGLRSICFETTGQDMFQIENMKKLLNKVQDISGVKLNLYIMSADKCVFEVFEDYQVYEIF